MPVIVTASVSLARLTCCKGLSVQQVWAASGTVTVTCSESESDSEFLKQMNVNVKAAVIEVGEGYARCKEYFPEARLFWDIRNLKTILNFRACPQMVERLGRIDALFYTTPCYDNTSLKLLNNYGTTPRVSMWRHHRRDRSHPSS